MSDHEVCSLQLLNDLNLKKASAKTKKQVQDMLLQFDEYMKGKEGSGYELAAVYGQFLNQRRIDIKAKAKDRILKEISFKKIDDMVAEMPEDEKSRAKLIEGWIHRPIGKVTSQDVLYAELGAETVRHRASANIEAVLLKHKGHKAFEHGDYDLDILKLSYGEDVSNPVSKDIYKAIRTSMDYMHTEKVTSGYDVGIRENYIGKRDYDLDRIINTKEGPIARPKAKEEFVLAALDTLDLKASGLDPKTAADSLEVTFDKMALKEDTPFIEFDNLKEVIINPRGKAIEKKSSFVFKNAEAEYKFRQKYGKNGGSLASSIETNIRKESRRVGLANVFGKEEVAGFEYTLSKAGITDPVMRKHLQQVFDVFTGKVNQRPTVRVAKGFEILRKLTDMRHLSSAGLSVIKDMPVHMLGLALHTKDIPTMFQMQSKFVGKSLKAFVKNGNMDAIKRTGVFLESVNRSLISGAYDGRDVHDMSKTAFDRFHKKFMSMTLMQRVTNAFKEASADVHASIFADYAQTDFNNLYRPFREQLERHNIHESDWAIIRDGVEDFGNGDRGVTLESIRELPDERFGKSSKQIKENRSKIENMLTSYLISMGEAFSLEPRGRQNFWWASLDANSVGGQFMRSIGQYKGFALAMYSVLGDAWNRGGIKPIAGFVGTSAMLAHGVDQVRNALAGKDVDFSLINDEAEGAARYAPIVKAFISGGTAGLIGDFVNAVSQGPLSTGMEMLSPSLNYGLSAANTVADSVIDLGKGKDISGRVLTGIEKDIPIAPAVLTGIGIAAENVPYLRQVPWLLSAKLLTKDMYTFLHTELDTGAKRAPTTIERLSK